MNVYFTASIVGRDRNLQNYRKIIDILTTKGFKVMSDHIMNTSPEKIRMETKEERLKFHSQLEKNIRSADFMVIESTFPSISVGYEISIGLHFRKPVLILYSNGDPPSLLAHHADEKLICEKYTPDTVKEIIDDFVNYIEGKQDTRFTFFITPEIAHFLEKKSQREKLPKSVYLRKLIEKEMKNK
ncbi:hypothetical protein A2866_00640 [Candidatus Roizmanbacteria bacterium RIFCSPHIGHO2_01_FULL_39_8]|uniref:2'-deoxynucleoside 5'-phosphate N-hydrolase 1 n=2 Tax=Candidatus Roizmaniibacteriota TaxID=1752723 RepID=A0A1F7GHR3_9BACT|nr:MAG: hypothetical protein A2866_00640 [Candidatus Roizmanbacteria bacterium RIFCSPHIGHO2_01_FULL_39_8]OGK27623.1 MAG: hypothetical protein A3C28_04730 [Candidatus Roizmanbacteria bacterium RIFCSPHIGHO2_02_FULL_39_9]